MDDNASDPKILNRLKGQPPYDNEEPQPEEPQEELVEETVDTPEDVEEEVTDEEALANSKNPERTKKRIEQLKEQARRNVLDESTPQQEAALNFDPTQYFQNLTPQQQQQVQNVPQQQAQDIYAEMVGQDGYLDQNKFFHALRQSDQMVRQAQEEARRAREEAQRTNQQFQTFYRQNVMREVHQNFPSLDPNNSEDFDPDFFEKVRNEIIYQQTQGKAPDPMAAAQRWYNDSVNKKEREQKAKADNARANINATRGTSPQRQTTAQRDYLVDRTRAGGKSGREALNERLKAIGQ